MTTIIIKNIYREVRCFRKTTYSSGANLKPENPTRTTSKIIKSIMFLLFTTCLISFQYQKVLGGKEEKLTHQ